MRTIATLLLALMTVVFVLSAIAKFDLLPYVRAFSEAGMIGACADWFAVVALLRRPIGLPILHTGIVPNNKERNLQAVSDVFHAILGRQNWLWPIDQLAFGDLV
jgi:uncharacterized membrane-anchored protein YjiN (DUF445 family)